MTEIEASFITLGNVQYGEGKRNDFYKLVRANNKNTWNWVGVSVEEFELARKEFAK